MPPGTDRRRADSLPIARLTPEFTHLASGVAGGIVQKLVHYRLRLVVVGPLDHHVPPAGAAAGRVREANRGRKLWFGADLDELDDRLSGART